MYSNKFFRICQEGGKHNARRTSVPGICLSSQIISSSPAVVLFFHFNRQLQISLLIFIEHACVKGICGVFP